MTVDMSFRVDTLDRLIAENLLIRNAWTGRTPDGRDTACLLAALSPEVGAESRPSACPADVMPAWFAELTPWLDDKGSVEAWPAMARRSGGGVTRAPDPTPPPVETPRPVVDERAEVQAFVRQVPRGPRSRDEVKALARARTWGFGRGGGAR